MSYRQLNTPGLGLGLEVTGVGSAAVADLNTAFTYQSSGNCVGLRYAAPSTDPINEFYLFLSGIGGTRGNITCACDLYNERLQLAPGTTQRATTTNVTIPGSNRQWVRCIFETPYSPGTAGEILFFLLRNTSASPTVDYPSITVSFSSPLGYNSAAAPFCGVSAGSGWGSNGTIRTDLPWIVKHGSDYYGQPFSQSVSNFFANNTRRRGLVLTPVVDIEIDCVQFPSVTQWSGIEIYDNDTAPGGTTLHSFSLTADANKTTSNLCGSVTFAPITLSAGLTYKVVLTLSGNNTGPNLLQNEDYSSFSTMFDAIWDSTAFGPVYGCIDNGSGGWTIHKDIAPGIFIPIRSMSLGGSGGGPLIGGRLIAA